MLEAPESVRARKVEARTAEALRSLFDSSPEIQSDENASSNTSFISSVAIDPSNTMPTPVPPKVGRPHT